MNNQHNKRTFQRRGPYTYLPEVTKPYEYPLDTYLYYPQIDQEDHSKLIKLLGEMLDNDCWAAIIQSTNSYRSEVLFNFYNPYSSYRTRILDEMIHSETLENPDHLLDHIMNQNKEAKLRIYMGYETPWTINVWYKPKSKVFQVSFCKM